MRGPYKTPIYTLNAQKAYRARNPEAINKNAREYYHEHRDEILLQKQMKRDLQREADGLPPIIRKVVLV
jgi:hypothetical protein